MLGAAEQQHGVDDYRNSIGRVRRGKTIFEGYMAGHGDALEGR